MTLQLLRLGIPYYEVRARELHDYDPIFRAGIEEWERLAGIDRKTILRRECGRYLDLPAWMVLGVSYDEELLAECIKDKPIYLRETPLPQSDHMEIVGRQLRYELEELRHQNSTSH